MSRQHELDAILQKMGQFPKGASPEEIRVALQWPASRVRTMQRCLTVLVQENLLLVEGKSRKRLYRLPDRPINLALSEEKKTKRAFPCLRLQRQLEIRSDNPFTCAYP